MPNQLNYETQLQLNGEERPARVSATDLALLVPGEHQVLFGTESNDNIEFYIYDVNGSIVSHVNFAPTYPNIKLQTIVDQSGAYEYLELDLKAIGNDLSLQPGRYVMVANIFRNEVGNETGYKLYIATISPSRTELRLQPVQTTAQTTKDFANFLIPSVPPEFAQGLIDQIYGKSLDNTAGEFITQDLINAMLSQIDPTIITRIQNSNVMDSYTQLVQSILTQAHIATLNILAANLPINNNEIEKVDLEKYIQTALIQIISQIISSNAANPLFMVT